MQNYSDTRKVLKVFYCSFKGIQTIRNMITIKVLSEIIPQVLITCHPTDIKVYLLGYLKGFLLFFKRYSQIIRKMITMKVLLRIISLGTCSLKSCEHQYIPFECLCYCKITPSHTYHNCHPVVTEYLKRHLNDI